MSRSVIERRRKRIRGRRALRPLVLCGAMLAPALLAAGLLAAELTGYQVAVRRIVAEAEAGEVGEAGEGWGAPVLVADGPMREVVLEPRIVPPPYMPDRVYGGWAPPIVTDVHRSTAETSPAEVARIVRRTVPRESPAPQARQTPQPPRPVRTVPAEAGFGCPGEWRETWLWEVCKEQARREA